MLNNDYSSDTNNKPDSLQATIDSLKNLVEQLLMEHKRIEDWITEKEAIEITSLSRGTLLKLRKSGKISSSTLSGKQNFYRLSDFKKLLELNEQKR